MHTNIYKPNPNRDSRKSAYFNEKIKKIAVTHKHTQIMLCQ